MDPETPRDLPGPVYPRRFSLDSPYYNPLAARADAHQRARILRAAAERSAWTSYTSLIGAERTYLTAAVRQEAIGNGEAS